MELDCYASTNTGRVRPTNQDAVGCFPDVGLFAVADGMGGHESGEVASRMAVENLQESFVGSKERSQSKRLLDAVLQSNLAIFEAGRPDGRVSARPMGTTVIALSMTAAPKRITWAYVGDSRLYRYRKGELKLLTADHTRYGGKYNNSDEIPLDLPHTNELLAALGIEANVQPGAGSDTWRKGDTYLLCSDGISGMITAEQIEAELAQDVAIDQIGSGLISRALEAGGSDNASVVLVRATA